VPRCRANHRTHDVTDNAERRAELAQAIKITSQHGIDGAGDVFDLRALQILRLESTPRPAASGRGVIPERSAQAVVVVDGGQQRIQFAYGGARSLATELEQPADVFVGVAAR